MATTLLCHFDGPVGSNTFTDVTGHHTLTGGGNALIDNSQSVFGGTSVHFESATFSRIASETTAAFNFGLGPFTIDFWARVETDGAQNWLLSTSQAYPAADAINIFRYSDDILYYEIGSHVFSIPDRKSV